VRDAERGSRESIAYLISKQTELLLSSSLPASPEEDPRWMGLRHLRGGACSAGAPTAGEAQSVGEVSAAGSGAEGAGVSRPESSARKSVRSRACWHPKLRDSPQPCGLMGMPQGDPQCSWRSVERMSGARHLGNHSY